MDDQLLSDRLRDALADQDITLEFAYGLWTATNADGEHVTDPIIVGAVATLQGRPIDEVREELVREATVRD